LSRKWHISEFTNKYGLDAKYVQKLAKSGLLDRNKLLDNTRQELAQIMKNVSRYETLTDTLFSIRHDFENNHLTFPSALKGTIGELLTMKALIDYIQSNKMDDLLPIYFGGTTPGVDIIICDIKQQKQMAIQVKTQFYDETRDYYRKYGFENAFGSPTISMKKRRVKDARNRWVIEREIKSLEDWDKTPSREFNFDFLVLTIIRDETPEFYIFTKEDVQRFFKSYGCWSGKYGDVTIVFIDDVKDLKGKRKTSQKEYLKKYPKKRYSLLKKQSLNAWNKLFPLLIEVYGSLLYSNERLLYKMEEVGKIKRTGWKLSFDRLSSSRQEAVLNLVDTGNLKDVFYSTVYRVNNATYDMLMEREMGKQTSEKWKRGNSINHNNYRPVLLDSEYGKCHIFLIPEKGRTRVSTTFNSDYVMLITMGIEESYSGIQLKENLTALKRAVFESQVANAR